MKTVVSFIVAVLAALLFLTGCQTTGGQGASPAYKGAPIYCGCGP